MPNIVTKKIKGKDYLYLVESIRKGKKVIQKVIKYIGKKRPVPKHEFDCMVLSFKKQDWILTEFKDTLSYQDHHKMKTASNNYKKYLKTLDKVSREKEKEKFLSVFISNSNAIEGSTLTINETYNYLFEDITPKGHSKKELFMASNLLKAFNYVETNFKRFPKKQDLFELHKFINKDIESNNTLGKYKEVQNYIGDIYTTSHLFVEDKMKKLFNWIKKAYKEIDDFEVAFQSHAQFEVIHPFVDGNGRLGRLLMNWLLMYKGLMYFAIPVKKRSDYLTALNNFRKGKIKTICKFCFKEYMEEHQFV